MNIASLLQEGCHVLNHLETSRLDAEVLLSYVLAEPREFLFMYPETPLTGEQISAYRSLLRQRVQHVPIAYLTRRKAFYGRDFYVDERTHIPRPATEDLIEIITKDLPKNFNGTFADIGTGSGCIAITLAVLYPKSTVLATDISTDALAVAKVNALMHNVEQRINFLEGDLFKPLTKPADVIIANPPYGWRDGWSNDPEVLYQPDISNYGGSDGLDIIRHFLEQLPQYLTNRGEAYLKFDPRRIAQVEHLMGQYGFSYSIHNDTAGFPRIALIRKGGELV